MTNKERILQKLSLRKPKLISAENLTGDKSHIFGNAGGLRGDASNIWGNVGGLYGDVSDISGNVSDIRGDVSNIRLDTSEIIKILKRQTETKGENS